MNLSERSFVCEKCGHNTDRDMNAAINIRRFALISSGLPTDSGEVTPGDNFTNTMKLLEKEGIGARMLDEAHGFNHGRMSRLLS